MRRGGRKSRILRRSPSSSSSSRRPPRDKMGAYLGTPKTEKFSEEGENNTLKFGLSSMQGWRTSMEDAHTALLDLDASTSFFGVYDGHGGKAVSKFCAKHLHYQILKYAANNGGNLVDAMQKAFLRIDEMMQGQRGWKEITSLQKTNNHSDVSQRMVWSPSDSATLDDDWPEEEGPHSDYQGPTEGSTACVALIKGKQIVVGNAGDSRCVISRKGQAVDLSTDHKPELGAERDRIFRAGGFVSGGRVNGTLALSRAIGDMEFKEDKSLPAEMQIVTCNPDVNSVELDDDDDFLVLACDGIWECMSSQQVVDFIHGQLRTESSLSAVCGKVLDRCLAPSSSAHPEGLDNMTMILVQFKRSATPAPAPSEEQPPGRQEADP